MKRFRITPPGERTRPLVPDVAFVSYAALPKDAPDGDVGVPTLAPTAADKVVIVIDPILRTAETHDRNESRTTDTDGSLFHPALPGLTITVSELFAWRSL